MSKSRYLGCAETAKLLRKALKKEFPGVKFYVRSDSSIDIHWCDGPTEKEVKAISDFYAGQDFDGMIDMRCYWDHWLLPDGTVKLAKGSGTTGSAGTIPPQDHPKPHPDAELVSFGSSFVFCHRVYSKSLLDRVAKEVHEDTGWDIPEVFEGQWWVAGKPRKEQVFEFHTADNRWTITTTGRSGLPATMRSRRQPMPSELTLEQVSTETCRTHYKVTYNGQVYDLELWIIVGGTPCVQVSKNYYKEWSQTTAAKYAPSKRFEPTPEVKAKWDAWDSSRRSKRARNGAHPHQDPDAPQGPTIEEVLPNGLEDLRVYLATTDLTELDQAAEKAAEKHRWEEFCSQHRLPPKYKWPKRELEEEPRVLPGRVKSGWVTFRAKDLRKTVKGLQKSSAVEFLGCVISPTVLRQVASVFGNTTLRVWSDDGDLFIEPDSDPPQLLHFLNGAGDKYLGRNGVNARLEVR
jgi:hypothetical protein